MLSASALNGLNEALLTNNPNLLQPQRIDRSHAATGDQDHAYKAEQQAFDSGRLFLDPISGEPYGF